jgi:hypothetical protein
MLARAYLALNDGDEPERPTAIDTKLQAAQFFRWKAFQIGRELEID